MCGSNVHPVNSGPVTRFGSFAHAFLHDPVDTIIRNIATLFSLHAIERRYVQLKKRMSAIEKTEKMMRDFY